MDRCRPGGNGALRHLVRDLPAARLARIDPEEFFVFTQERPEVRMRPDGGRDIHWPRSEFFAWHPGEGRDGLLLFCGPEPHQRWQHLYEGVPRCGRALWGEADRLARGAPGGRAAHPAGTCHGTLHRPRLAVVARSLGHLSSVRPTKARPASPRSSWTPRSDGASSTSASWGKRRTICKIPRIRRRSRPW